jgi:glycosyltransferase involved in cell wall biosynthesis
MPSVSVIIPLYQTERYILDAIRSVQDQTFRDFEIIVVDDGSTDRGPEIVARVNDRRLRLVHQENRGLAGARHTGVREAKAPILAFLDADDLWHPLKLERLVAKLDADERVGVAFSASAFMDENGREIGLVQRPANRPIDAGHVFCRNPVGNGSAPVIRRAAFDAIAFFDDALGRTCWFDESFRQSEDIECWTRIAATEQWTFAFVDEPLTLYRVGNGGLSSNVERQLETWRRFRAKVRAYAPRLEEEFGNRAEAYQLRYLARRAVRSSDGGTAMRLAFAAVKMSPSIIIAEPGRTLVTLAASVARRFLPDRMFGSIERAAINATARRAAARS